MHHDSSHNSNPHSTPTITYKLHTYLTQHPLSNPEDPPAPPESTFFYLYKLDLTDITDEELTELKVKLLETQIDMDTQVNIIKARYIPVRKSYQIQVQSSSNLPLKNLLATALSPGYGTWIPALDQEKTNSYLLNLDKSLTKWFSGGKLYRLLKTGLSDPTLQPVEAHLRVCAPPRLNGNRATLIFQCSQHFTDTMSMKTPPMVVVNLAGPMKFLKASDIRQRAELAAQMENLSFDLNNQA